MPFAVSPTDADLRWIELAGEADWADAAAADIAAHLRGAIAAGGEVRLLLSGGGTPAPVYRALARLPLDWARVRVGLVDERASDDPAASNALLLRDTLLTGHAAAATLEPLHPVPGEPAPEGGADALVAAANARHGALSLVCVFGMGDDGHTASLFPGDPRLPEVLDAAEAFVPVDASAIPGARGWPRRVTLTPAGWDAAAARVLLLRGEHKRALFGRALESGDVAALPVRALFAGQAPLTVYWCP
ncbi:6-phosphogluconolactonase [Coralloluteibacterium thermophilus]|uniref:6-phosphogluconolactonase n=1 Tax=Coralloluteibacterium thermophilum TaxID=2707049 RepID=A0ABV9NPU9_9GAMM